MNLIKLEQSLKINFYRAGYILYRWRQFVWLSCHSEFPALSQAASTKAYKSVHWITTDINLLNSQAAKGVLMLLLHLELNVAKGRKSWPLRPSTLCKTAIYSRRWLGYQRVPCHWNDMHAETCSPSGRNLKFDIWNYICRIHFEEEMQQEDSWSRTMLDGSIPLSLFLGSRKRK